MISAEEAKNSINSFVVDWGNEEVGLDQALGNVLTEEILADRDFPPFDRVAMDGIAISYKAYSDGIRTFEISNVQYAGQEATTCTEISFAVEIMTGAVLCQGCDVIIRYEDVLFEERDGKRWATVQDENVEQWKNIHRQGMDETVGNVLVPAGEKITIGVISILATTGYERVKVKRKPKVAIISTGDELVDVGQSPLPHQIRKSNVVSMATVLNSLGVENTQFHLQDDQESIQKKLTFILRDYDVILLSGGVSMGKADFIPLALEALGVKKSFHKVAQRPGKPLWFGGYDKQKAIFALPGNPVSTLMCFTVYFIPWLQMNLGMKHPNPKAILTKDIVFKPNLDYFAQVLVDWDGEQLVAEPIKGNGSGDVVAFGKSNGFLHLPKGQELYHKGEAFDIYQ